MSAAPPLRLRLPASQLSDAAVDTLRRILAENPGDSVVLLDLGGGKVLRLPDEHRVEVAAAVGELRVAFGHGAVIL
jgi:DNA polymerase-3 subunit alpha